MAIKTWNGGGGNNNWTTGANWGGTAPVANDALVFAGSTRLTPYNDFAAGTSFNSITFASGAGAFTLGGNRVTIGTTAGVKNSGSATQTVDLALTFNNAQTLLQKVAGPLVINGVISGTGGIKANGANPLSLLGANTYTGKTYLVQGDITINSIKNVSGGASSFGAPTTVANGTIDISGFEPVIIYTGAGDDTDRVLHASGGAGKKVTIEHAGSGTLDFTSMPTGAASTKTLIIRGSSTGLIKFTAAIADVGGAVLTLQKEGSVFCELNGNNSYTGPTNINAGKLRCNGNFTGATGAITVASGAVLGGFGNIYATTTIQNGGILSPSMQATRPAATFELDNPVVLNSTSKLEYLLGTASDRVDIVGNLTLDGVIDVTAGTGFAAGTYRIFNYSGTLTNNTLTVGTLPVGYTAVVDVSTPGDVDLIISATSTAKSGERQAFGQARGQENGQT